MFIQIENLSREKRAREGGDAAISPRALGRLLRRGLNWFCDRYTCWLMDGGHDAPCISLGHAHISKLGQYGTASSEGRPYPAR
jgi:hypothetical protein